MADPKEVLFSITREELNTGMRGFPTGTVRTSMVDPNEGVSYVGYPIAELAYREPEEVIYLLFYKELPTKEQLAAFTADLDRRSVMPPGVVDFFRFLPLDGHPMEWLIAGLVRMGMTTKTGDYREDGLNLVARAPELVAALFRIHQGWGDPIPSRPELGLIENFVHMLGVPGADPERLVKLLRVFYVLHMDHGGGNLSTFCGKAIASSLPDVFVSMAGAMSALYGPLHGRANQECLEFVQSVGTSDPDEVEKWVRDRLATGKKVFGFGHAVLRKEDPRAAVQYELGKTICPDSELFKTAVALRDRGVKVLKENPKISNPYPNVDAVSGSLLHACGLTDPEFYTVLFGLSRIVGISAQIVDERTVLRDGKGVPIYRPADIPENQPKRHIEG